MKLKVEGGVPGDGRVLSRLDQFRSLNLEIHATMLAYSSGICPAEGTNNFQLEDLSADAFQRIEVV